MPLDRRHLLTATVMAACAAKGLRSARASMPGAALSADERAHHALQRLAYGPTPQDAAALRELGPDAWLARWLQAQLQPEPTPLPEPLSHQLADLEVLQLGQGELFTRFREATRQRRENRREMAQSAASSPEAWPAVNPVREQIRPLEQQAATARLLHAHGSPNQLEEVLTEFWFNHFNVYAGKGPVGVLVADYEARAIRPHVLGRFRDLLGATAKHPAMLLYLDNAQSVAPGFKPRGSDGEPRGLNENYARELMELHTLGVDGGYTQRDVTELARILTGWGLDARARGDEIFEFNARRHDPGTKTWLGETLRGRGQYEGEHALDVLARHPATARFVSFKLAQAFVADEPPPALVQRLAERFTATDGDLRELTRALIQSPEFWSREAFQAKFKTPYQHLLSSLRAVGAPMLPTPQALNLLQQAGQPLYGAVTPDGYKNTAAAWRNPEALTQRVQWATRLAQGRSADALLATLGPAISERTREAVRTEAPAAQAALLLASPDFMKR
ncbi:DUF1800 family protein [Roseateles sp.]|uniref:DUF1800 domain-containing protein n=1 Tax=Roseateles sp. TaxID=1971397 RepID=UPI00393DDDF6